MTETTETGTDVIRAALAARNKKLNFSNKARDWGIASETVNAFIEKRAVLSPETLCVIAKDLFQNAEYDPELDLLRPVPQSPPLTYAYDPPKYAPSRQYEPGVVPLYSRSAKAAAKPKAKRAGWIG